MNSWGLGPRKATVLVYIKIGVTSARGWIDLCISMVLVGFRLFSNGFQPLLTLNSVPYVLTVIVRFPKREIRKPRGSRISRSILVL